MTVIIVTGTPGTGKSTLAQALAQRMGYTYIDVSEIIEQYNLREEYDEERQSSIVDVEKLGNVFAEKVLKNRGNYVLESHLVHHLRPKNVSLCIVTKCELKTLKKRLEGRGYSQEKVRENLDAEIFENCLTEAEEIGHKILIVDTSHTIDIDMIMSEIKKRIGGMT